MKIKKLNEFVEDIFKKDMSGNEIPDLDRKISQEIYDVYSEEFEKTNDIWKALEDTSNVLDMTENDIYLHIINLGEGSMFEKLNEGYNLLTEDAKYDKILTELSYQRKKIDKIDKKLDKTVLKLDETIQNINNTNIFLLDLVKSNNIKNYEN